MAAKPPPKPSETNYITPVGFRRLADELTYLHTKKRPEVVGALSDAAAEGDRSENAEYIYRKRQLRDIDRRLRFLSKRLDDVQIVDPAKQPRRDRVFFGAQVTIEDQDGETATYRIVGVDESDGANGDISWKSPVGRSLLGKTTGDTVVARWPSGFRELTIAKIVYAEAAAAVPAAVIAQAEAERSPSAARGGSSPPPQRRVPVAKRGTKAPGAKTAASAPARERKRRSPGSRRS
ncbi:MAG TPA: transcription elongation factor GreB [Polyangia bacterium]